MKLASYPLIPLAAIAVCPSLLSQQLQLQGPTSGLIYEDSSRSIRPILGLAGGAHLGPPLYAGLDYASIAPNGRYALVVQSGHVVFIHDVTNLQALPGPLAGTIANPSRILWAADSSAAVLCAAGEFVRVQRVTGLNNAPGVENPIVLTAKGRLVTLATDPAARKIVLGIRGRTGGGFFLVSEYGDVSLLASTEDPSAAAFTPDGQDLYAADRGAQQILVFRNVGPGATGALALDVSGGISDPVGLASFGQQLLVASGAQRSIRAYTLPALTLLDESQLDTEPQSLDPVPGSPYYRLTSPRRPGDSLWLLDARSELSVFFVPSGE